MGHLNYNVSATDTLYTSYDQSSMLQASQAHTTENQLACILTHCT